MMRRNRSLLISANALAAAFVFSACANQPLPPLAQIDFVPTPALTEQQSLNVLADISATLESAAEARDPELLNSRVYGPALTVRASQIWVAAVRDDDSLITVIPDTYQQLIIPVTDYWPRTAWAITAVTDQLQPPRLLAFDQSGPRDPYRLWGWVQLVPGVTMPAFNDPRVGSEEVPADDASLKVSPQEAVAQYAQLLATSGDSPYAANFQPQADDPFRDFLATWVAAQQEALAGERVEGTYTLTVQPAEGNSVRAVRSADGGAMVLAELFTSEQLQAVAGAVLAPQTMTAQALLYGQEFTNVLTAEYTDMIALYIPPAGSPDPITLLGYSHIQTGAGVTLPESQYEQYPEPTE